MIATAAQTRRAGASLALATQISSLLLLLCVGRQLCGASAPAPEAPRPVEEAKAHKPQPQPQAQPQQPAAKAELLGQLIQMAAAAGAPTTGDEGPLERLLAPPAGARKRTLKPSKRKLHEQQAKEALRQKWHALVDELIDSGAQAEGQSLKRLVGSASERAAEQQQQTMDKRKLGLELDGGPSQAAQSNGLADLASTGGGSGPQAAQQQQQQVNMAEHARRILDDKFDILRQSIFTSNNQLGTKGVPKFGSDEQF